MLAEGYHRFAILPDEFPVIVHPRGIAGMHHALERGQLAGQILVAIKLRGKHIGRGQHVGQRPVRTAVLAIAVKAQRGREVARLAHVVNGQHVHHMAPLDVEGHAHASEFLDQHGQIETPHVEARQIRIANEVQQTRRELPERGLQRHIGVGNAVYTRGIGGYGHFGIHAVVKFLAAAARQEFHRGDFHNAVAAHIHTGGFKIEEHERPLERKREVADSGHCISPSVTHDARVHVHSRTRTVLYLPNVGNNATHANDATGDQVSKRKARTHKRAGLPPGSMIYIGEHEAGSARLRLIRYSADGASDSAPEAIDCAALRDTAAVSWLHVTGLADTDTVRRVGECAGLHPLEMEDIVNTMHRSKMDMNDTHVFCILKHCLRVDDVIHTEHIAVVLTPTAVVSFSEHDPAVFGSNTDRILGSGARIRERGADYLFYTLLDSIVDQHVALLEEVDDDIGALEDRLVEEDSAAAWKDIHLYRRNVLQLRRAVLPLRDIIMDILRSHPGLIDADTRVYLRDVYDHIVQILETVEHDRDMLAGLMDLALARENRRMSEVMKVLTMIATVFIPLTFIAGVYGMNFSHMPELHWPWAYPAVLGLMLLLALGMLVYFRKKDWL